MIINKILTINFCNFIFLKQHIVANTGQYENHLTQNDCLASQIGNLTYDTPLTYIS